jgi:hypothetical protein
MSDIYINEATGKKIKLYKETMVHVYDHEDPRDILDFTDTAEVVGRWCFEDLDEDHDDYDAIEKAYDNEEWEKVIELSGCRYCEYDIDFDWVVEEVEDEAKV